MQLVVWTIFLSLSRFSRSPLREPWVVPNASWRPSYSSLPKSSKGLPVFCPCSPRHRTHPCSPRAGGLGAAGPVVKGKKDQAPEAFFVSDEHKTIISNLSSKHSKHESNALWQEREWISIPFSSKYFLKNRAIHLDLMPVLTVPKSTAFALREWTIIAGSNTPAILLCHSCRLWHSYWSCLASIMQLLGWTIGPWSVYCSWMRKLRSQKGDVICSRAQSELEAEPFLAPGTTAYIYSLHLSTRDGYWNTAFKLLLFPNLGRFMLSFTHCLLKTILNLPWF